MAAAADEEKSLAQTETALSELRQRQDDLDKTVRDASHRLQALEVRPIRPRVPLTRSATWPVWSWSSARARRNWPS